MTELLPLTSYIYLFLLLVVPLAYLLKGKRRNPNYFCGKNVLVTGGASGIGREICLELARKGAKILIFDVQDTLMKDVEHQIKKEGGSVEGHLCDLTNRDQIKTTIQRILEKREDGQKPDKQDNETLMNIDILINNAGIVFGKSLLELEDEEIQRTIDVNLMANFWTVREILPRMIQNRSGHIVTVSSVAGVIGMNDLTDYCTSKYGSFGFAECLRREVYLYKDINTTVVCPWIVNSGMFAGAKQILLPALNTRDVAMEIICAIEDKTEVLMLPRIFHLAVLVRLLPTRLVDWIAYTVGAMNATEGLIGRGKEWNMKKLDQLIS